MADFIRDPATHSAGVLAAWGREHIKGSSDFDQLLKAVGDWLEEAEVTLDLDATRAALAAIALVQARAGTYMTGQLAASEVQRLLAECAATFVELFENPRPQLPEVS